MPEIVKVIRTQVHVDKSIEQLEQELFLDGNIDWDIVVKAYKAQFPAGAKMTDKELDSVHPSQFNRIMIDHFLPYMQKLGHKVTGMRTICDEEITRDLDGYVNLACDGANDVQNHWVTMNVDGDVWELRFFEYSYEGDEKTQLSTVGVRKNGVDLVAVYVERECELDYDALRETCRSALPNVWQLTNQEPRPNIFRFNGYDPATTEDGDEVKDPAYLPIRWYEHEIAVTIAMLIRYYK